MALEVIDKGTCSAEHPAPLLFVHGATHAAWCWDDHFLGYFADLGYRAVALSLRGHGGSNSIPVGTCSIADFVDDVASVAAGLPRVPVLIGHSMGGFVVQKYLESYLAPAAVLMASVPPRGMRGALLRSTVLRLRMRMTNPRQPVDVAELQRVMFFHPDTTDDTVAECVARLSTEAPSRAMLDMLGRNLPRPGRVRTPLLVLGGGDDRSVTRSEVCATARAYGMLAEIMLGMGHDMMLEPRWEAVAGHIDSWLAERGL